MRFLTRASRAGRSSERRAFGHLIHVQPKALLSALLGAALAVTGWLACTRVLPADPPAAGATLKEPTRLSLTSRDAELDSDATSAVLVSDLPDLPDGSGGSHEIPLGPGRSTYYAVPRASLGRPWRLLGHLHGICYPPSYSCGRWRFAGTCLGVLVCPTGNARCGDAATGPPSWEAPTWEELVTAMDHDLERSIASVVARHPDSTTRDGAILTGFSRGAYAAPVIARRHPGRWPLLVLIEANVPLDAASLRNAWVRAVALVAGEKVTELKVERKTAARLDQECSPGHLSV